MYGVRYSATNGIKGADIVGNVGHSATCGTRISLDTEGLCSTKLLSYISKKKLEPYSFTTLLLAKTTPETVTSEVIDPFHDEISKYIRWFVVKTNDGETVSSFAIVAAEHNISSFVDGNTVIL